MDHQECQKTASGDEVSFSGLGYTGETPRGDQFEQRGGKIGTFHAGARQQRLAVEHGGSSALTQAGGTGATPGCFAGALVPPAGAAGSAALRANV